MKGESTGGRKHEGRKQRIQARVWFGMLVLLVLAVLLTLQVVGSETRFSRRSQTQTVGE